MVDLNEVRRQKLIMALLECPTNEEAFEQVGISGTTGYRIMKDEDFQREFREASRRMYDDTFTRLSGASTKAYKALIRALDSENENVSLKAALGYYQLMSNPKLPHNDAEIAELKGIYEDMKRAIMVLDVPTRKAFMDEMGKYRTG